MKILLDFKCISCGEVTERFIDSTVKEATCECGSISYRLISMPTVKLDGTNPDFPGAYNQWANIREQRAKVNAKRNS